MPDALPRAARLGRRLKRRLLIAYGARGTPRYMLRTPLLRLFVLYTRLVYERLARDVARQVADYDRAGFTVVALIGVGASPSCGVHTTLDIGHAFDAMARLPTATLDRRSVNREVVRASRRAGAGIFIRSLQRQLRRRGLDVPLFEHDLVAEMRGERQRLLERLPEA